MTKQWRTTHNNMFCHERNFPLIICLCRPELANKEVLGRTNHMLCFNNTRFALGIQEIEFYRMSFEFSMTTARSIYWLTCWRLEVLRTWNSSKIVKIFLYTYGVMRILEDVELSCHLILFWPWYIQSPFPFHIPSRSIFYIIFPPAPNYPNLSPPFRFSVKNLVCN
jgi:hypothetical protein